MDQKEKDKKKKKMPPWMTAKKMVVGDPFEILKKNSIPPVMKPVFDEVKYGQVLIGSPAASVEDMTATMKTCSSYVGRVIQSAN